MELMVGKCTKMMGIFLFSRTFHCGDFMKSSILRAGVVALACALGLSACGGGSGDLYLSGTVRNVTKDGLVLTNNGGNDTAVVSPYASFQFSNRVSTDDQFDIKVKSVPSNVAKIEDCVVTNGRARANYYTIAQISVTCTIKTHPLTVSVKNLTGSGLVVVNGADRHDVPVGTTSVTMAPVYEDGAYGVTVLTQPTGQTCTVSGGTSGNGSGIMGSADAGTTVTVTCS
jgi:hypothetical protein